MRWFDKIMDVVEAEYDRRIRKSSEIVAYGMGHGHHHDEHDDHNHACCGKHDAHDQEHQCCGNNHAHGQEHQCCGNNHAHGQEHQCCGKHDAHTQEQKQGADEDESAIVANVPAGTRVRHRTGEES